MRIKRFRDAYRIESSRLHRWDYGSNAAYFVTICTDGHDHYFGDTKNGIMHLSEMGVIAQTCWQEIPEHVQFVGLGSYVIMPNHVHGIIIIDKPLENINADNDGGCRDVACNVSTISKQSPKTKNNQMSSISPKSGSLSTIIRSYKSAVTKHARQIDPDFVWQPRYYDHVIRNPEIGHRIRQYVQNNVQNWSRDRLNQ